MLLSSLSLLSHKDYTYRQIRVYYQQFRFYRCVTETKILSLEGIGIQEGVNKLKSHGLHGREDWHLQNQCGVLFISHRAQKEVSSSGLASFSVPHGNSQTWVTGLGSWLYASVLKERSSLLRMLFQAQNGELSHGMNSVLGLSYSNHQHLNASL